MLLTICVAAAIIALVLLLVLHEGTPDKKTASTPAGKFHGVRRSPRVPISVAVKIQAQEESYRAQGQNISHYGMLVIAAAPLSVAQPIHVDFTLPDALSISIPAVVAYKNGQNIGLRFDPTHPQRHPIEKWVNDSVQQKAAKSAPSTQSSAPRG